MATLALDPSLALKELAAECENDPLAFARGFWPDTEPRKWQTEILGYIGEQLQKNPHKPIRVAVASGNGIGKSALIGMVLTWAMATGLGCKGKVTAGKAEQLETKTAPEVARWFKSSLCADWFDVRAKSIRCSHSESDEPENWRIDFETWTEEKPDTFQGLHNHGKRLIMVFDEGSAIADVIYDAAETSLTDKDTQIIWLAFGNPVRNTGRFRELFGSHKHIWKPYQIDSRTVEGVNPDQINEWIKQYGEDSDFVRVKVRGEFPRAGSNQFIAGDVVERARTYKAEGFQGLPKILAVDVARFGADQTVIGIRQGRYFRILGKYRGQDTMQTAAHVFDFVQQESPDAVVVDDDGVGGGVVDRLRQMNQPVFPFLGGHAARDVNTYFNRRAEVWGLMRDALNEGMQIPDDPELARDLVGPEYSFSSKQQIQLERKEDMKKRQLNSPDCGDCLAMTFGVKVLAKSKRSQEPAPRIGVWS